MHAPPVFLLMRVLAQPRYNKTGARITCIRPGQRYRVTTLILFEKSGNDIFDRYHFSLPSSAPSHIEPKYFGGTTVALAASPLIFYSFSEWLYTIKFSDGALPAAVSPG